jgi:3-deoxy-manno-octulosonate cytidylyltransferase (CMP-KDO synthetase)
MGSIVAVIPARYDSTRLPGKPLADLGGLPMIQRVYERAARAACVDRVLVATDDERIRAAVAGFGGDVVMTSAAHSSGTDRIAEAVASLDADIVVNVQGDLPLLDPALVDAAVEPLRRDVSLPLATLMTPIRDAEEMRNPNVVKVVTDAQGFALYFSRSAIPFWRDGDSDLIRGFRHLGLYVFRRDFLLAFARLPPTRLERAEKLEQLRALENGYRVKVVAVEQAAIEVDTADDLEKARQMLTLAEGGKAQ